MPKAFAGEFSAKIATNDYQIMRNDLIVGGVVYDEMICSDLYHNQSLDTWEDAAIIRSWSASFADPENMTRLVIIHILSVGEF